MTGQIIVQPLDVMAEARWSFRDEHPIWQHGKFGTTAVCDPFPAYPHTLAVVSETAARVADRCPPLWNVDLFVADLEERGRSNGFSNCTIDGRYDDAGEWVRDQPKGLIWLSGKRVPPHPAVSRYLVAHEYGHNVEWMLNYATSGPKDLHSDDLVRQYATLRGLPPETVHHGAGGRWHNSATEIFACDFRVIICDVEAEYWPHLGIPTPRDLGHGHDVWAWWAEAVDELAKHAAAPSNVDGQ